MCVVGVDDDDVVLVVGGGWGSAVEGWDEDGLVHSFI